MARRVMRWTGFIGLLLFGGITLFFSFYDMFSRLIILGFILIGVSMFLVLMSFVSKNNYET